MRRQLAVLVFGLSCVAVGAAAAEARAFVAVAPRPAGDRLFQAQTVVVGKVTAIEDKEIDLQAAPNVMSKYKVAVVKVSEVVKGVNKVETIRIAFQAAPAPVNPKIKRPIPGVRTVEPKVGQEALLYVNKHARDDVYLPVVQGVVLRDSNPQGFAAEVAQTKHKAKLLQDPMAGLRSKDARDRLQTASLLLGLYRGAASRKTEPIPAEESRLILDTILFADWNANDALGGRALFQQLGLTPKDGWKQPNNFQQFPEAAQNWLRQYAASYRIQRFVPEAGGPVQDR